MSLTVDSPAVIAAAERLCEKYTWLSKDVGWRLYSANYKQGAVEILEAAGIDELIEAMENLIAHCQRLRDPAFEVCRASVVLSSFTGKLIC